MLGLESLDRRLVVIGHLGRRQDDPIDSFGGDGGEGQGVGSAARHCHDRDGVDAEGVADIEHVGDTADAVTVDRVGLSVPRPVDADEPDPEPVEDLVRHQQLLTTRARCAVQVDHRPPVDGASSQVADRPARRTRDDTISVPVSHSRSMAAAT